MSKENRFTWHGVENETIHNAAVSIVNTLRVSLLVRTAGVCDYWQYGFSTDTENLLVLFTVKQDRLNAWADEYFLIEATEDDIKIHTQDTTIDNACASACRIIRLVRDIHKERLIANGGMDIGDGNFGIGYLMGKVNK